jgi:hypothetical protein
MSKIVEALHGVLLQWWVSTPFLRKLGDTLVAGMLGVGLLVGYGAYEKRDTIIQLVTQRVSKPVLNHARARAEIQPMLDRLAFRGVVAIFVLQVDLVENRRSLAYWTALESEREAYARIAAESTNVPLVGDGTFDLAAYKTIVEGRPNWLPGIATPNLRLVVPVPPVYRQETVGLVIVGVRPNTSENNRTIIESQIQSWAYELGTTIWTSP